MGHGDGGGPSEGGGPSRGQGEKPTFEARDAVVAHLLSGNYHTVSGGTMKMPAMQRPFEWDAGQCKKFLQQILTAFESDSWHSLGNIFLWRKDADTTEVSVMDGAHRVTCIFILMAVLRHIRNTEFKKIKPDDILPTRCAQPRSSRAAGASLTLSACVLPAVTVPTTTTPCSTCAATGTCPRACSGWELRATACASPPRRGR